MRTILKFLQDWWAGIFAIIFLILEVGLDMPDLSSFSWPIVFFFLFVIIQAFKPQRELNRIRNKRPKMSVKGTPKTHHPLHWYTIKPLENQGEEFLLAGSAPIPPQSSQDFPGLSLWSYYYDWTSPWDKQGSTILYRTIDNNDFVHVDFVNNLTNKEGVSKAEEVAAKVSFFSQSGRLIFEDIPGRWENTPEPTSLKPEQFPVDFLAIDIPANGTARRLTIAVKHEKEPVCYPYSPEWFGRPQEIRAKFALREGVYLVRVVLSGNNAHPPPFWFELLNRGRNDSIDLRNTEQP